MKKTISVMLCMILLMTVCSLSSAVFAADKHIDGIEIVGVDITIGGTPNLDAISVPSGAKYKIIEKYWKDNTGAMDFSQFLDLHKYTLTIEVEVDEGYAMDYAPFVKVNGKEHAAVSIVQYGKKILLQLTYSFLRPIKNIDLPAFPDAVPMGKSYPSDECPQFQKLIETDTYTVYGDWRQHIPNKGSFDEFVFAEGAMYFYALSVGVKSGYEITADTVFTAGGKTVSRSSIYDYFYDTDATVYRLFNHTSLKPISVVDITVAAPTVGNNIDTQAKTATAGVVIDKFFIQETTSANVIVPQEMGNTMLAMQSTSGNYVADKQYIAKGYIEAANGYYFTEDLTIRVNGKETSIFRSYIYNMFGMGSPTKSNPFILLMGKAATPTTTTTAKPTQAKPTTTTTTVAAVDDQSDIGEPTESETVSDVTTSEQESADDTATGAIESSDGETTNPVLTIVLSIAGGVLLLGGGATGVILWLKKKRS